MLIKSGGVFIKSGVACQYVCVLIKSRVFIKSGVLIKSGAACQHVC